MQDLHIHTRHNNQSLSFNFRLLYNMSEQTFVTVGRRKTARARVRLTRGTGKIEVNGSEPRAYFKTEEFANAALSPSEDRRHARSSRHQD